LRFGWPLRKGDVDGLPFAATVVSDGHRLAGLVYPESGDKIAAIRDIGILDLNDDVVRAKVSFLRWRIRHDLDYRNAFRGGQIEGFSVPTGDILEVDAEEAP
jgi:hypothetical protein